MKKFISTILIVLVLLLNISPVYADTPLPNKGSIISNSVMLGDKFYYSIDGGTQGGISINGILNYDSKVLKFNRAFINKSSEYNGNTPEITNDNNQLTIYYNDNLDDYDNNDPLYIEFEVISVPDNNVTYLQFKNSQFPNSEMYNLNEELTIYNKTTNNKECNTDDNNKDTDKENKNQSNLIYCLVGIDAILVVSLILAILKK